jgi:hypothetical protein
MENENVNALNPEERLLDFGTNKVEILNLDELKLTTGERYFGNKEQNGIAHHEFISKILELTVKIGLHANVEPIYAAQNKSKFMQGVSILPELEKHHGERSVKAHILRRVLTRIVISDFEDDISSSAIAISYHQEGIEVALGPNIKVCSNQCIMGSGRYLRTYGPEKIPGYENMLEIVGEWLHTFKEKREEDIALLKRMMDYQVTYESMAKIIGELSLMRVGKDELRISNSYPLSQSQISKVSKAYLEDMLKKKKNNEEQICSLYDVYNYGTAELKPESTEIPNVLIQNASFGDYILDLVR